METEADKPKGNSSVERKQQLVRRFEALKTERATWLPTWRDIAEQMRPRGFREHRSDVNRGTPKHQKIINFTPLEATRTLASGMMAGITSPSRPWFRLALESEPDEGNSELGENSEVKQWLSEVEGRIRETLAKSNIYKGLHLVYADLGPFGTSTLLVEEDGEDDVRAYVFPLGSYVLASSARGDIDTMMRELSLTVAQVVELFGAEACSEGVRRQFTEGLLDERVDVVHAIVPNTNFQSGKMGPEGKRWSSYWWEARSNSNEGFLREAGYNEFPLMAPRWEVTGEDVYGHGPGYAALGDCRALQLLERRAAQAADKVVNPPMTAPSAARNQPLSLLPGEWSFADALGAGQAVRPAVEVNPAAIGIFEAKIREHERRIRKAFFADLWLLLSESQGQMTAREVAERREEKLLQLGTVLEALQDELLDPLIDRVFAILLRRGRIPPPPDALQGKELKVEYISIMAQAQKLLGTTGLERLASFVGNLASVKPDVIDKLDWDQLVDEMAEALGVPPATVRADELVLAVREKRVAAQEQAAQVEQAQGAAQAAKTLSETDTQGDNGLTEMLRAVGAR